MVTNRSLIHKFLKPSSSQRLNGSQFPSFAHRFLRCSARFVYYLHAGAATTLYDRKKADDGRSLSSEQAASMRPTDTSAQWIGHAVEEPHQAEPATCSNCEKPRERPLSWFFYGGGKRRVVVLEHMVGKHRCSKHTDKSRGVFKPTNKNVETITKDGLLKVVDREARKGSNKESGGN